MRSFVLILFIFIGNVTVLASEAINPALVVNSKEFDFKEDGLVDSLDLSGPYDAVIPRDMPSIVPISAQQKIYLSLIVQAIFRVIISKSPLESEERIFGGGKFFWAKNPSSPVYVSRYYPSENFNMRIIGLGFERKNSVSSWGICNFLIHPRNFPLGVYSMDFSSDIFEDFVLDDVFLEERPMESLKRVNVFKFHHKYTSKKIYLTVKSAESVSSLHDKFPRSFYLMELHSAD